MGKAKAIYDPKQDKWVWEKVSWKYCKDQGLYISNRGYPKDFWTKQKWAKKKRILRV